MSNSISNTSRKSDLPLKELSIEQLYNVNEAVYEIPIYQRNFAWESDEIASLIRDIYNAYSGSGGEGIYHIGTLVTFHKGDNVFEVIDGQQRLTVINLILHALDIQPSNRLTYKSRKKANVAISALPNQSADDADPAIIQGFAAVQDTLREELANKLEYDEFKNYFLQNVHIVHYQVPKDVNLNHYFEVMNSRGKQLEKHEVVKARLLEKLNDPINRGRFSLLWDSCSQMSTYIQRTYSGHDAAKLFGSEQDDFTVFGFEDLPGQNEKKRTGSIRDLLMPETNSSTEEQIESSTSDTFQPIINFPNFLLIVLKLTMIKIEASKSVDIALNDKELLSEFEKALRFVEQGTGEESFVKQFGFNLLKAKYLLDNYVVHHVMEEDMAGENPWKLQYCCKKGSDHELRNLSKDNHVQSSLVHLLSMYEVCFTSYQRKNYLLYCLLYLFEEQNDTNGYSRFKTADYAEFLERMSRKFLNDVYLQKNQLNEYGAPIPGAFDDVMLADGHVDTQPENTNPSFIDTYGFNDKNAKKIPLFVFNYLDYLLWKKYSNELHGESKRPSSPKRKAFFADLGCSDFGLEVFKQFYFSRTRRSLEHFFPVANANGKGGMPDIAQVNRFGNYAMISSDANSSGSNWSPATKLSHYLDVSGKINQVGVASLKFRIMMQRCKDNKGKRKTGHEWLTTDIDEHQEKMIQVLLGNEDIG